MSERETVIVTGASRGMGSHVALWLAKAGCAVAVTARSADKLQDVAREIEKSGGESLVLPGDVAEVEACKKVVNETLHRFGRLDGLVNNAGILQPVAWAAQADAEAWRYNIEVNLLGPFYLIQAAIPALRETEGRVVNVGTGAAVHPIETWSAYCASKAGMVHLTRVLAEEEPAVTFVTLRPGVVDTEMQARIRREGPGVMPPHRIAYFQSLKEKGRLEPPEIPARSIAWLALHAPREWSGQMLDYDDSRIKSGELP